MAEPVKISIPAAVATFVRPGVTLQERLRGAEGAVDLPPREQVLLLFCLGKDTDPAVRSQAAATMASLDSGLVLEALDGSGYHPALLHSLALVHGNSPAVRAALLACTGLADVTRERLQALAVEPPAVSSVVLESAQDGIEMSLQSESGAVEPVVEEIDEHDLDAETDEGSEEYLSKYKLAQVMGIGEKIKMALTGDKEWRKILIKDANKLVSCGVIKNPRMSEPEVLTVLKSGVQNDEIMRLICANKEWVKNYQIRKALLENPKTPLSSALRYLGTMNEKDIANYAKSRNISSVISTQAKRMLLNKKR